MEVKAGYKQTEVGVIPEGWRVKKLGELCTFTQGVQIAQSEQVRHPRAGYIRYLYIRDYFTNDFEWFVRDEFPSKIMAELDIMMVNTGSTAGMVFTGARGVLSNNAFRIRFDKEELTRDFLFTFLTSPATQKIIREFANAAAQPHVGHKNIAQVPIGFPPLTEQHTIATALSDVDGLLGGLDRLIAKKRDLKQAAMQQLLTGHTRLPGFYGEWEVKTFGELFNFSGGYSASRDQLSSEGHPYLHYGDIHGATKTFVDVHADYQNIPKLDIPLKRVASKSFLEDGDVVFVDASEDDEGTSRHVVVVNKDKKPFISGLHTIVAKSKTDELAHEYRRYCFQTAAIRQQFLFYAVGTKVSGISKTNIPKLTLLVPSVPEQTAIAEVLTDMDAELASLEQRREKTRTLKHAMMQELLTGKTRLVTRTKAQEVQDA